MKYTVLVDNLITFITASCVRQSVPSTSAVSHYNFRYSGSNTRKSYLQKLFMYIFFWKSTYFLLKNMIQEDWRRLPSLLPPMIIEDLNRVPVGINAVNIYKYIFIYMAVVGVYGLYPRF